MDTKRKGHVKTEAAGVTKGLLDSTAWEHTLPQNLPEATLGTTRFTDPGLQAVKGKLSLCGLEPPTVCRFAMAAPTAGMAQAKTHPGNTWAVINTKAQV